MADPEYFTLAQLRALPDMSNAVKYTEALVLAAASYITAIIEREVGTSFIARATTEAHSGGCSEIVLRSSFVQSVTSATENGVTVTDTLRAPNGVLRRFSGATSFTPIVWAEGVGNVSVTYQAGYSTTPPADIREAAMQGTRARLLETASTASMDDRRTSISNDSGTVSFVIAGEGRPTGFPVVDEVIMGWKLKLDVYGFA